MDGFNIHPEVAELFPELIKIRRDLHTHPELMYDLPRTSAMVASYLQELDIEVHTEVGRSGVVGIIWGEGPCFLLRADMDALPITELIESDYKSENPGKMHACGHDAHVSMLLIAAKVISRHRSQLKGSVKFMFQPAEEGGHGALAMRDDAVYPLLEAEPRVDEVYAIHMGNEVNLGDINLADYMSTYSDRFEIEVRGKGGHASSPHMCIDPIITASELVLALNTIISRNINTKYKTVLSVTYISGGETFNAISDTCTLKGTIRTYETEVRDLVIQRMNQICDGIGIANNCSITFNSCLLYPPTKNDQSCMIKTERAFRKISPNVNVLRDSPMIGEDFCYLTDVRPGCYYMLGCSTPEKSAPLHSPNFTFDERALMVGASWWVQLIQDELFKE